MAQTTRVNVLQIPVPARPTVFTMPLGGVIYTWRTYWLAPSQCWVVNIADQFGNPLIQGVPLVPGTNLLGQYAYVGPGGVLFVRVDHDPEAVPDFTHLGITARVFWRSEYLNA